ncbi:hypothetical protein I302_102932 [Kwoniella bestiolae CBS 10118]|uniref:BZIP domain-containing protein n=1 Tax=Kwoniella bestiolae CBS 10118 TaxID=1296100 RepID=A0A1B9GGE1_9TREE|nr:hypothetical protein I302_01628 [Kwoniella bestiolae CBS 10118]OCF30109.1 hypothetical protein I302_01628 [Kwoniella bestiolae CBS 10118]
MNVRPLNYGEAIFKPPLWTESLIKHLPSVATFGLAIPTAALELQPVISVDPDGTGLHFLSSCKSARPTGTRYTRSTMTKSSVAKYRPNRDKTMTQQARDKKRARDRKYTRERKEREGAKLNSLHETIAKLEQEKEESELVISSMSAEKGRMSSKIDQSSELVDNLMTIISDMSSRCNTLQAENDSLRNAIKFYGPKCSHFIHQMSNLSNGFAGAIQMNDQYNASRIRELEQQLSFGCDTPSFSLDTNQVEQVPKQESMDDRTWLSGT